MHKFSFKNNFLLLSYPISLITMFSCSNSHVPQIDPAKIDVGGYVASSKEFNNDPIKQKDFGMWELVEHLNYYYAKKYKGKIDPAYYIMFVNIAGFETERFGITVGPDDDSRFSKNSGRTWKSLSIGLKNDEEIQSSNHIRAAVRFSDELNGKIVISLPGSVWSLITSDGGLSWTRAEIPAVRNKSRLFSVYLSRNTEILTLTSIFEDRNESFILKYNNL